jgi:hypothetical protein
MAFGERSIPRHPPYASVAAVPALQGARSSRRPTGCSVDASPSWFAVACHDSAMDARRATGGWRALPRQGRSPCKRRPACLARERLALSGRETRRQRDPGAGRGPLQRRVGRPAHRVWSGDGFPYGAWIAVLPCCRARVRCLAAAAWAASAPLRGKSDMGEAIRGSHDPVCPPAGHTCPSWTRRQLPTPVRARMPPAPTPLRRAVVRRRGG